MGFPILVRCHFYIESGPKSLSVPTLFFFLLDSQEQIGIKVHTFLSRKCISIIILKMSTILFLALMCWTSIEAHVESVYSVKYIILLGRIIYTSFCSYMPSLYDFTALYFVLCVVINDTFNSCVSRRKSRQLSGRTRKLFTRIDRRWRWCYNEWHGRILNCVVARLLGEGITCDCDLHSWRSYDTYVP